MWKNQFTFLTKKKKKQYILHIKLFSTYPKNFCKIASQHAVVPLFHWDFW